MGLTRHAGPVKRPLCTQSGVRHVGQAQETDIDRHWHRRGPGGQGEARVEPACMCKWLTILNAMPYRDPDDERRGEGRTHPTHAALEAAFSSNS